MDTIPLHQKNASCDMLLSSTNVYVGFIFGVRRASFPAKWLEWGLSGNIVADFSKDVAVQFLYVIVTDG